MGLATFAKTYRDFYAPAFSLLVGGQDVVRNLLIPISQIEVDLMLGTASRFSFTVTDCYRPESGTFKSGAGEPLPFSFGSRVSISLGYRDSKGMKEMIQGVITEVTTDFPEGGSPELTVSGFDNGFLMTIGKVPHTWQGRRDTYVAQEIADSYNLDSRIYAEIGKNQVHEQTERGEETDWAFLQRLAERNHFVLFMDETSTLHFHPRESEGDVVVELAYGKGLLSFKPEANLADQICGVEVQSWDPKTKQPIVGIATAGEESGRSGTSGGEYLKEFVLDPDKRPILRIRLPAFTQAEANQRASAALNECAKQFLTGEGETIGLPEIRPNTNIALTKLGRDFSRPYYIKQATHKIDTNGYRTRFKVEETKR